MPDHNGTYNSDESLAKGLQHADQAALGVLYDRYSPMLFRVLQKMTPDTVTAEKVLTACFISIWQNKNTYRPSEGRLLLWVIRTAIATANAILGKEDDWKKPDFIVELIISKYMCQEEAAKVMEIPLYDVRQLVRKEINQLRGI